jgi:hypothetical protein
VSGVSRAESVTAAAAQVGGSIVTAQLTNAASANMNLATRVVFVGTIAEALSGAAGLTTVWSGRRAQAEAASAAMAPSATKTMVGSVSNAASAGAVQTASQFVAVQRTEALSGAMALATRRNGVASIVFAGSAQTLPIPILAGVNGTIAFAANAVATLFDSMPGTVEANGSPYESGEVVASFSPDAIEVFLSGEAASPFTTGAQAVWFSGTEREPAV